MNTYVAINRELRQYELSTNDWEAITMVTDWLKHFRAATVEMSTTQKPMLSTVHVVFRGLQRHLKGILAGLPDHTLPEIKKAYSRRTESSATTITSLMSPHIICGQHVSAISSFEVSLN